MDFDEFVDQLRRALGLALPDSVDPSRNIYGDDDPNSLQVYELLVTVEDLAGADLPPTEIPHLVTVAEAYAYYEKLRAN